MLAAMLISAGVVFLAELGDKSQLITMTYALRHRWWVVLSGVAIAAFAIHGISVTVGHFLGLTLPARPIAAVAGVAFLGFAAWTWREGIGSAPGETAVREPRFVLFAVVSSVLLAELGDKTMLATVALASDRNWLGVWLGPPPAWCWPMRWRSPSARCCTAGCPRICCTPWPDCSSWRSVCGSCSTKPCAVARRRSHRSPRWRR